MESSHGGLLCTALNLGNSSGSSLSESTVTSKFGFVFVRKISFASYISRWPLFNAAFAIGCAGFRPIPERSQPMLQASRMVSCLDSPNGSMRLTGLFPTYAYQFTPSATRSDPSPETVPRRVNTIWPCSNTIPIQRCTVAPYNQTDSAL